MRTIYLTEYDVAAEKILINKQEHKVPQGITFRQEVDLHIHGHTDKLLIMLAPGEQPAKPPLPHIFYPSDNVAIFVTPPASIISHITVLHWLNATFVVRHSGQSSAQEIADKLENINTIPVSDHPEYRALLLRGEFGSPSPRAVPVAVSRRHQHARAA